MIHDPYPCWLKPSALITRSVVSRKGKLLGRPALRSNQRLWLVARESFSEDQQVHFSTLVMPPRAGADAWNARLVAASRAKALK